MVGLVNSPANAAILSADTHDQVLAEKRRSTLERTMPDREFSCQRFALKAELRGTVIVAVT
jgi:hypothetical protein